MKYKSCLSQLHLRALACTLCVINTNVSADIKIQPTATSSFASKLVNAAFERTGHEVTYNGKYMRLDYPGGDVPANIGVCTDVVIRSYRKVGVDLQVLVHEDMRANFAQYPSQRIWGLLKTDRNIDHRRVPNLQTFFSRHGESLNVTTKAINYQPGDLVSWKVNGNLPHIGIVTSKINETTGNPMIVHNIGSGPVLEDMLFDYTITGHYRYAPK
jgi:uncharacterized protein YijF (DUF1287 family)